MSSKKILLTFIVAIVISTIAVILADLKIQKANETFISGLPEVKIHLGGNPSVSLKNVTAKVIYFVPSDLTDQTESEWQNTIDQTLMKEQKFFNFQLDNAIGINYQIYNTPVIGLQNHLFYDSTTTERGNPHALISVREEIINRIFTPTGDLYRADFAKSSSDYEFIIIIYGSTGASALIYKQDDGGDDVVKIEDSGPPAIILSSAFLSSPLYREFGPTVLAHEIGHAFGLTDSYDMATGVNLGTDIMGEGRRRILTNTFISDENKKLLGF